MDLKPELRNSVSRASSGMKIVGPEFRESVRNIQKEKQDESLKEIKKHFLEAFKKHGLTEDSILDPNTKYWFMEQKQTHLPKQLNPQEVFKNCLEKDPYIQMKVGHFINRLISEIEDIHYECSNYEIDVSVAQESERILSNIVESLKNNTGTSDTPTPTEQQSQIEVFYVNENKYKDEIFEIYKIKYRAAVQEKKFKNIYSWSQYQQKDDKFKCVLNLTDEIESIYIQILGKAKSQTLQEEYFQVLSTIEIPFFEIISAIKPTSFQNSVIPPAYLIIPYQVKQNPLVSNRQIDIELGFKLKLGLQDRIKMLENQAIKYYQQEQLCLRSRLQKLQDLIDGILVHFKDGDLTYNGFQGLEIKKYKRENKGCYAECQIF